MKPKSAVAVVNVSCLVRVTGGSLQRGRCLCVPLNGNKEGSKGFTVLSFTGTPTRFPTNSLYTPMGNIPLYSISSVCHPWSRRCCKLLGASCIERSGYLEINNFGMNQKGFERVDRRDREGNLSQYFTIRTAKDEDCG